MTDARRGDPDALQRLWELHRRWIAAVLLAYKPRTEDLEDLLQEVAMTMVRKVHTLRDDANIKAWLRVVAINVARAAARSTRGQRHLSLSVTPEDQLTTDPKDARDGSDRIASLVAELSDLYREPLVLRALHGMRSRQIAEILDIPVATVDTRIARARVMLTQRMREMTTEEVQPSQDERGAP